MPDFGLNRQAKALIVPRAAIGQWRTVEARTESDEEASYRHGQPAAKEFNERRNQERGSY
jgi:hypothetical protein